MFGYRRDSWLTEKDLKQQWEIIARYMKMWCQVVCNLFMQSATFCNKRYDVYYYSQMFIGQQQKSSLFSEKRTGDNVVPFIDSCKVY